MTKLSEISILVVDDNLNPRDNAEVTIYWDGGGHSSGRTGQSGQVVLSNLGTVDRITVHGKVAYTGPVSFPNDASLRLKT
jgi:hypothetical protein